MKIIFFCFNEEGNILLTEKGELPVLENLNPHKEDFFKELDLYFKSNKKYLLKDGSNEKFSFESCRWVKEEGDYYVVYIKDLERKNVKIKKFNFIDIEEFEEDVNINKVLRIIDKLSIFD